MMQTPPRSITGSRVRRAEAAAGSAGRTNLVGERLARDFARGTGGAALIEAALVLPILVALLFALADLSLYFWETGAARKAAQLGARVAAVSDAVAVGPGLTRAESAGYWFGLTPGARCAGDERASPCPSLRVECDAARGCVCEGGCRYAFSDRNLAPILAAMRAVLPDLAPAQVRVGYATNGLGFVGYPPPVPVDVTVRVLDRPYRALFLGALFARALPIRAAATVPGEDLAGGGLAGGGSASGGLASGGLGAP